MKEAFDKLFQTKFKNPVAKTKIRKIRNLVFMFFAIGFFCFLLLGSSFLDDISLLDSASLKYIRDTGIDKDAFFRYVCMSHMVFVLLYAILWWYQKGKACVSVYLCFFSVVLGGVFAVSLMRYYLKGIVLWVVLYFPQCLCYLLACGCGLLLSRRKLMNRKEKIQFLLQNFVWILLGVISLFIGIYCECYISSAILQTYLYYF